MKNSNIIFRILNIWFSFITFLVIGSVFPHWNHLVVMSWANEALYFLILLLTITIIIKDQYNKDIFMNLSIFLFIMVISFVNVFIGSRYLMGNDYLMYYIYQYIQMSQIYLLNFMVIYITIKFVFTNSKTWLRYILASGLVSVVFAIHYLPYLSDLNYLFKLGENYYIDFYKRGIQMNMLSLCFFFLYGYYLYKHDRTIGEYINTFMAFLLVFVLVDTINKFSIVYNFMIFNTNQIVLTMHLCILSFILIRKLLFLDTEYGQFYESLINQKISLGKIKIQRRQSKLNMLVLRAFKVYLIQRRNFLLSLSLISVIFIFYFSVSKFLTYNVITMLISFAFLFCFVNILYHRRSKKDYTLP